MAKVVERKTVLIINNAGTPTFNYGIFLNFQPDEVKVTQYSYFNAPNTNSVYYIISSLVDNRALFSFNNTNGTFLLNNTLPITQYIQGSYTFECLDINSASVNFPTQLSFILEFVKYDK